MNEVTHDLKLSPVGLRASTLSLGHVGCPQYSIFTIEQGGTILFFETWNAKAGDESAISDFPSRHQAPVLWYCCYIYTNTLPDYWYQDDVLCILAGIYKLISKTVPIIDFYDIDDVLFWFKYIYIYIFICVVKTHLCSTEAIDNVVLYNDVVIRAYNKDVLVIRGWQYHIIKWRDRQFKWR